MSRESSTERSSQRATGASSEPDLDVDHGAERERARRVSRADLRRIVQKLASRSPATADVHDAAARGVASPETALPHADAIQASFGPEHDISQIRAHVGGTTAADMGANAYASGNHVVFDRPPDLHTAAHEAAHVVQQARGVNLYGGVGEAGDAYERHADAVADRVVAGRSAADLLGAPALAAAPAGHAVQRDQKHAPVDAKKEALEASSGTSRLISAEVKYSAKLLADGIAELLKMLDTVDPRGPDAKNQRLAERFDEVTTRANDDLLRFESELDKTGQDRGWHEGLEAWHGALKGLTQVGSAVHRMKRSDDLQLRFQALARKAGFEASSLDGHAPAESAKALEADTLQESLATAKHYMSFLHEATGNEPVEAMTDRVHKLDACLQALDSVLGDLGRDAKKHAHAVKDLSAQFDALSQRGKPNVQGLVKALAGRMGSIARHVK